MVCEGSVSNISGGTGDEPPGVIMNKAMVLIDEGFQEAELLYCYYRLREEGYIVDVVGDRQGREYEGEHGYPLMSTKSVEDVGAGDYVAIIVPGGRAPDRMRTKEHMVALVRDAADEGKVIAAICHGPQLLIEANVLRARRATCHPAVRTDLINAGASYEDDGVVADGNVITAQDKDDLPDFMKETIETLKRC